MDKDKLYRVAFFLTYHKQAREGWFWRVFGMAFDGRLRQTLQNIAVDYRKTSQNQPLAFDDYLEMLLRHEEEKTGMSAERNQSEQAVVKAFSEAVRTGSPGRYACRDEDTQYYHYSRR